MSVASRTYCERRIERIDRQLAERRSYVGPTEFGYLGRFGDGENVDDLLEQRAKWMILLERQS